MTGGSACAEAIARWGLPICAAPRHPLTGRAPEALAMAFMGTAFVGVVGFRLRKRREEEAN